VVRRTKKQKYVPKLASGEWFGAYCLTEPGAGSDANSGTKVLSEDGKYYTITGQKKCGFRMQVSVAYLSFFARIGDKNITVLTVVKTLQTME
jgi:alkylation response protein AidB-like acyl-CoA dehydrogenase